MNNNIISRKLTLLLIKYIPVIQMTGIFINRLLDYFTSLEIVDILDFIFGSTILATTLLISCSRTFKFCVFHRVIIMCNLVIQMLYIINNNTEAILLIFQIIIYNILHCSTSTFEKYVQIGLIPQGKKVLGFKEKSWSETDFDEVTLRGIREYKRTHV